MTHIATPTDGMATSFARGEDGIAIIGLSGRDGRPFILDEASISELEAWVTEIENDADLRGALIVSTHDRIFCAGADVEAIADLDDPERAREISKRGQILFSRIEDLPIPIGALIHGTCLGGGLELALACHLRIVSDDAATRLGLPEVQLGIVPAWGGCTRLPEIVGLASALSLLLTGRRIAGRKAAALGLAIECVPRANLMERGRARVEAEAHDWSHGHRGLLSPRRPGVVDYLIDEMGLVGRLAMNAARRRVMRETKGHYPAPLAIIDVLEKGRGRSRDERFALERSSLGALATGLVSKHLVSIFTRNRDAHRGPPYDQQPKSSTPIRRVAVIGAGVMGQGIAITLLMKGLEVRIVDPFPEALVKARKAVDDELSRQRRRRRIDRFEVRRYQDRLSLSDDYRCLGSADLVIEAVPEVPAIKETALRQINEVTRDDAILATNTSSLSIKKLAEHVKNRGLFAGLHFFNPAPKMPLVEIVRTDDTDEETIVRLVQFVRSIGKTPIVVSDSPAFIVNRILGPYLLEAFNLMVNGAGIGQIDSAARGFGLPMGPFELMDNVGLDVVLHVTNYLAGIPEMGITRPTILEHMVDRGDLGKKSGRGFYVHGPRRSRPRNAGELMVHDSGLVTGASARELSPARIAERLLGVLGKEAERVLDEGVVATRDDLDLASIFGMGFPPHTGGIATWLRDHADRERAS